MVFVGAAILPHGAQAFDGDMDSPSEACRQRYDKLSKEMQYQFRQIHEGSCKAGEQIAALEPDLIVLHSPHGIKLSSSVGIVGNSAAEGTALWNGCWSEYKVKAQIDTDISKELENHFRKDHIAVETITAFNAAEDITRLRATQDPTFSGMSLPLRWGEVIPIWYLLQKAHKEPKFIILSQCRTPVSSVDGNRLKIGQSLAAFLDQRAKDMRVAVVISADLSHLYDTDCENPVYLPSKGWSFKANNEAALNFERSVSGWVKSLNDFSLYEKRELLPQESAKWNPRVSFPWLEKCAELQPAAYSCGMVGFLVLHALMEVKVKEGVTLTPHFLACAAPTYFGMMAATFLT